MCRVGRFLVVFAIFITAWHPATTLAGARIDLRPAPPPNGSDYQVGDVFNVEVFMVDTGNPQGAIGFRFIQLDFTDSLGFSFPGDDGASGTQDDNMFTWDVVWGTSWSDLPVPAYACNPPVPNPICLVTMPESGEVQIGHVNTRVDSIPATLDVMNSDEPDPNFGAMVGFGFGGAGDPITTWRAFTGDLTGGVLVIPEPATFGLMAGIVASGMLFKGNMPRNRRRQP